MASTGNVSEEVKMSSRASYTVNYNSSSHFSVITQVCCTMRDDNDDDDDDDDIVFHTVTTFHVSCHF